MKVWFAENLRMKRTQERIPWAEMIPSPGHQFQKRFIYWDEDQHKWKFLVENSSPAFTPSTRVLPNTSLMNCAESCWIAAVTLGSVDRTDILQTTCPIATFVIGPNLGGGIPIGKSWPEMMIAIRLPPNMSPTHAGLISRITIWYKNHDDNSMNCKMNASQIRFAGRWR